MSFGRPEPVTFCFCCCDREQHRLFQKPMRRSYSGFKACFASTLNVTHAGRLSTSFVMEPPMRRLSHYLIAPLGSLALAATLLGGCANPNRVVEYNQTFVPSIVDPQAYDVLVASTIYRPQTGLALGAGDHFGNIVHQEYTKYARETLALGWPDTYTDTDKDTETARSND